MTLKTEVHNLLQSKDDLEANTNDIEFTKQ